MSIESSRDHNSSPGNGIIKSPIDIVGGLFLLGLGLAGLAGAYNLPFGTLSGIGSGLMPKSVATMVLGFGVLLMVQGLIWDGDHLERWHARGPVFVLGSVLIFAIFIRGSTLSLGGFGGIPEVASVRVPPLGLVVAGPLAVIVSSMASRETRIVEVLIFAVVMTLLCGLLFKEMLQLPIPFDPAGVIPQFLNDAYHSARSALGHVFSALKIMITG